MTNWISCMVTLWCTGSDTSGVWLVTMWRFAAEQSSSLDLGHGVSDQQSVGSSPALDTCASHSVQYGLDVTPCVPDTDAHNGCVRLASLGRPRCLAVFSSRTNVGNYLYTFVLGEKPSHTGVDPGKLIERTHYVTQMHVACVDDRKGKLTNFLPQTNQKHRYQKLCHVYPMKSLVL